MCPVRGLLGSMPCRLIEKFEACRALEFDAGHLGGVEGLSPKPNNPKTQNPNTLTP